MTAEYRKQQLDQARVEWEKAKAARQVAKTKRQKQDADDDVEFWSNKLAFFSNFRGN